MKIGKVSESVLKRSVLRHTGEKREEILNGAGVGEDCAIFSSSESAFSVVCVQEAAIEMQGMEAVYPAVSEPLMPLPWLIQKCANNLAAEGAAPVAALIALLLPESTEESQIRTLMAEAEEKCRKLSMSIVGGQTRVTMAAVAPMAVVTGYGRVLQEDWSTAKAPAPGQDIVVSKWIGLQGTALLVRKNQEKLRGRYPAWLVEEAAGFDRYLSVLPEAAVAVKSGACAMHDASEGGIFGALWELAEGAGVGLTIEMRKLPLRQETVEVCECCGVNPYELLSGGCLIMTTWDGPGLVAALESERIPAVIVGKVTDSNDRILVNEDEVRYMDRPKTDEIYQDKE